MFPKNILISVELVTNLFVFFILIKRINITFLSVFISIVVSKIIYYLIKYAIVLLGVLEMEIISTAIYIQFIVAIVLSLLFAWGYKKNRI